MHHQQPSRAIASAGRAARVTNRLVCRIGEEAGIQFVIAYQDISASQMLVRMLSVAIIEAGLALLFFMHLSENRGLKWFVLIFLVAVTLGMQYGWTDSFRLVNGAPWAH